MSYETLPGSGIPDQRRRSPSVRIARGLNRVLTWGLPEADRRDQLAEADADWDAMVSEHGSGRVIWRALRGVPAWLWARLVVRNTTTLPAAAAAGFVAMGALTAMLHPAAYPPKMRFFIGTAAVGLVLGSATLLRHPHRLTLRGLGVPSLAAAIGMIGIALDLPEVDQWNYSTPVWENWAINMSTEYGLLLVGVGFAVAAINGIVRSRRVAMGAGVAILAGLGVFAGGQIAWGAWAATVDPWLSAASIVMGLAALSWIHVMPRLRHLLVE